MILGNDGYWRDGNAVTAKNEGCDRKRSRHVIVRRDHIDMLNIARLESSNITGEVSHRIDRAKIIVNLAISNA